MPWPTKSQRGEGQALLLKGDYFMSLGSIWSYGEKREAMVHAEKTKRPALMLNKLFFFVIDLIPLHIA